MKVSVLILTYNHERYIAKAIESAVRQVTNFDYEIVIGEDCSTDRTREIVSDYALNFPDRIRLLLPERNLGGPENFSQTLSACRGEYVALLEGDDYWTDNNKLQKQVCFLESEPECSICFHPVRWFYENGKSRGNGSPEHNSAWPIKPQERSTIEDLLKEMFIQTSSVMFRNGLINKYPDWLWSLRIGDWARCILLAAHGEIGCLKDVMSAYRSHSGGIWFAVEDESRYLEVISMYGFLNSHLNYKYTHIITPLLADYYWKLGVLYDQRGSHTTARQAVRKSVAAQLRSTSMPSLDSLKMLTRLSFPSLYSLSKRLLKA